MKSEAKNTKKNMKGRVPAILRRLALTVAVTLYASVFFLYGVLLILAHGPSATAKELFVMTVKETSAGGFLADICLPRNEIDRIMSKKADASENSETQTLDRNLIELPAEETGVSGEELPETEDSGAQPEAPEDISFEDIKGDTYNGIMMIVRDPRRVFVGVPDGYGEDCSGLSLKALVAKYGAVGGINAGGFIDPGGMGNGGLPRGAVIKDGVTVWGDENDYFSMIGFDSNGMLHVGTQSPAGAIGSGVTDAVCFGPALIVNGVPSNSRGAMGGGLNPRTAVGQRSDGAMLLLVVNGRSVGSLGATLDDLIDIFISYGAVNASNLDGGASSLMMYDGRTMNKSAYVYGERVLPNAILIK